MLLILQEQSLRNLASVFGPFSPQTRLLTNQMLEIFEAKCERECMIPATRFESQNSQQMSPVQQVKLRPSWRGREKVGLTLSIFGRRRYACFASRRRRKWIHSWFEVNHSTFADIGIAIRIHNMPFATDLTEAEISSFNAKGWRHQKGNVKCYQRKHMKEFYDST